MSETELVCAVLRVLVTNHAYGRPLPRDVVLNKTAYPAHKGDAAKEAFETVRRQEFVIDYGDRGIMLDNSEFGALVQYLYGDCDWERFELELRIKHFEGWENIEWGK
ncbi:hypothetical protein [Halomarina pelagica]|uniref:hypothetical protein n=1 Tax=Halomarina pelagica TaxID=2961599 RepID=UPI0020C3B21D|nr:hypothetical protein [Halomarina sp. BND7]